MQVWMYWEGPMPPYLELCVETVRRHHPQVSILDPAGFEALWQEDRDVPVAQLGPHHRSDFARAYLLRHHGGLWLDTDFVQLRPLDELLALPEQVTFAGYRQAEEFTNNLMFSRPGDPVMRDCYEQVCEHLRAGRAIEWLEIGAFPLTVAVGRHRDVVHEIDPDLVYPIPWYKSALFEAAGDAEALVRPHRYGVMLSNNSMSDTFRRKSRGEVMASDALLADLLRRALAHAATVRMR
jgi:Glycosyltransferase sugar-binding region containing DXD motif